MPQGGFRGFLWFFGGGASALASTPSGASTMDLDPYIGRHSTGFGYVEPRIG